MIRSNGSNGSGPKRPTAILTDAELVARLSIQYRIPTVDLDTHEIAPEIIALVPRELCQRLCIVPLSRQATSLIVAMADPTNTDTIAELELVTGYAVERLIATEAAIRKAIEKYHQRG